MTKRRSVITKKYRQVARVYRIDQNTHYWTDPESKILCHHLMHVSDGVCNCPMCTYMSLQKRIGYQIHAISRTERKQMFICYHLDQVVFKFLTSPITPPDQE